MSPKNSKPKWGLAAFIETARIGQRSYSESFVFDIHNVIRSRTGETGNPAIG
jgi:nitrogen regulatory protein PII